MDNLPSSAQILSGLPDAILLVDAESRIAAVNPAVEDLFDTSAKHIIGKPVSDQLKFGDDRLNRSFADPEASLAAHRMPISIIGRQDCLIDFSIKPLPADPLWRIITLSPLPFSDAARDSSSQTSDQMSVRAPDILSHEIKNPLAAIKGAAQLLARGIDEDQKILTGMITAEVERIVTLLDRMQSLSTTIPANIQSMNIHPLIDRARDTISAANDVELKIKDRFDPSLPNVLVDPDSMMQILTNLLSNAVDATKDCSNRCVTVTTKYSFGGSFATQGVDQSVRLPVEIIVADNGPGVPKEIENEIFSPFVSTKSDGQGLGLALVRKLVSDLNGRISYERDTRNGITQFIIFLPIAERGQGYD